MADPVTRVIKDANVVLLQDWLGEILQGNDIERLWDRSEYDIRQFLPFHVEKLEHEKRQALIDEAAALETLDCQLGEEAALGAADIKITGFKRHQTRLDRILWLLLTQPNVFETALNAVSFDRSFGRQNHGLFITSSELEKNVDGTAISEFERGIARVFEQGDNVHVEINTRQRCIDNNRTDEVIHALIYRETLPVGMRTFEGEKLNRTVVRKALEIGVVYSPKTGLLEVMCTGKEKQASLAGLFLAYVMGEPFSNPQRLDLHRLSLQRLKNVHEFSYDERDGIYRVRLTEITFEDRVKSYVETVKCRYDGETLREVSDEIYGKISPFSRDTTMVVSGVISVYFGREGKKRPQTIHIRFGKRVACSLARNTSRERLLWDKYLPQWGVLEVQQMTDLQW